MGWVVFKIKRPLLKTIISQTQTCPELAELFTLLKTLILQNSSLALVGGRRFCVFTNFHQKRRRKKTSFGKPSKIHPEKSPCPPSVLDLSQPSTPP